MITRSLGNVKKLTGRGGGEDSTGKEFGSLS